MDIQEVAISDIQIGARLRQVKEAAVSDLTESITQIGLLNPIVLSEQFTLIAGRHRIEAVKRLGWTTIPAHIRAFDSLRAELAEIDENLRRNELTVLEQGEHLNRRKAIYEALHPDAKAETRRAAGMNASLGNNVGEIISPTFAEDTAAKTGVSERTVQQEIQIANDIAEPVKELIRDTAVADSKTQLLDLARMKPKMQKRVAKKLVSGKAKSVKEAARQIKADDANAVRTQAAAEIKQTNTNIIVGDFRTNADKIPNNSLSLIFTDPPYLKDAEIHLPHLADLAARKLAPGGSCLFYIGHLQLPAAFKAFEGKLRHWWTCACVHAGGMALMNYYGVRVGWKPMLWFVKESRFDTQNIVVDTVSARAEKQYHDWQQAEEEAAYWIEKLCPADGIVCDPFLGGGTTAAAAIKLNRKWIGFEIDPETARIASGRLEKE